MVQHEYCIHIAQYFVILGHSAPCDVKPCSVHHGEAGGMEAEALVSLNSHASKEKNAHSYFVRVAAGGILSPCVEWD